MGANAQPSMLEQPPEHWKGGVGKKCGTAALATTFRTWTQAIL
jgi:hypothetical protein